MTGAQQRTHFFKKVKTEFCFSQFFINDNIRLAIDF